MTSKGKTALLLVGVVLGAAIGCGLGCFAVMKWSSNSPQGMHGAGHDWLHEHLELTHEQEAPMEEIEKRFAEVEAAHQGAIHAANVQLAEVFVEDQSYSKRVQDAVDKIHHAQAGMQKATIEHLVEMKTVLTEEQYQKVLELTEASLRKERYSAKLEATH